MKAPIPYLREIGYQRCMITPPPAEWAPHKAIWTAWPFAPEEWGDALAQARVDIAAMVRVLHEAGDERVCVLVNGAEAMATARAALGETATLVPAGYGDVWLRDTGPIFTGDGRAVLFRFNGWGGKYVMPGDELVGGLVASQAGADIIRQPFVLEGGGIEMDGEGTLLTTRQCLLNPNRNAGWDAEKAELALIGALGVEKVLWLEEGLANDHTDGHIDNLARFVAPGRVVVQAASGDDDPNADVLEEIALTLAAMKDARGRKLDVVRISSPGLVLNDAGVAMPASHMNFLIANSAVVVPTYNALGEAAVEALAPLFPGRQVIGVPSMGLLAGGGSFHCITQQEPK